MLNKSISKGSAIIYVIILVIPVLFAAISLLDLVSTDFLSENIVEKGNQARYNAESGIAYGIKMLQMGNYNVNYNYDTAYLFFDDTEKPSKSVSYSSITIKKSLLGDKYMINSEGYYMEIKNVIDMTIDKNYMLNLSRKFTAVNISQLSKANFRVSMNDSSINLLERNRFLIIGDGVEIPPNIKLYENVLSDIQLQKSGELLFVNSCLERRELWKISTKDNLRRKWKRSGSNIAYYVSEKDANIIIDLNAIINSNEELYRGFRDYNGVLTDDNEMIYNYVRLMLIDGDVTIKGIKGDLIGNNLSISQRYLNNIVVYCKGKLTIDDCVFEGYNSNSNLVDLNVSFIADEIDFKPSNVNVISYLEENKGNLIDNKAEIVDLIKQNTSICSDWWI